MLQIFNADSTSQVVVPSIAQSGQSEERSTKTASQTLARQLHAETEKRFFLEEAIDLLEFRTEKDSSTLLNVVNLLNRTAGTKQILIVDRDGKLIESSFLVGGDEAELSIATITWLIDQADRTRQRTGYGKSSISRLTLDLEILTVALDQTDTKRWMIVVGNSTAQRGLEDQTSLFESARRLIQRLIAAVD